MDTDPLLWDRRLASRARCTASIIARLLCEAIIWLGLIIVMLEEVRRLASSPELRSYGPPLANGTPPLVQLILLNAGETQDTRFPCNGLLSFRGVADPLLSARGAAQAVAAGQVVRREEMEPVAVIASSLLAAQHHALLAFPQHRAQPSRRETSAAANVTAAAASVAAEAAAAVAATAADHASASPSAAASAASASRRRRVFVAPHLAAADWGIDGSSHYPCSRFALEACSLPLPSMQRGVLAGAHGRGRGSWPHCAAAASASEADAARVAYDWVGGDGAPYESHADMWGRPNWPQFFGWLWQEERLWQRVPTDRPRPAVALVSHGSLLAEQLGYVPRPGAVHVQTVRFGEDPLIGLSLGQEHAAVEARPGWLCLHSCEF